MITIYNQHVMDALKQMPSESVDTIMTSPPYYNFREYGTASVNWDDWQGELGHEPSPVQYVEHLSIVTAELQRVLKPDGLFYLNINDKYNGTGLKTNSKKHTGKHYLHDGAGYVRQAPTVIKTVPKKSMMLIPQMLAIKMVYDQQWLMRVINIWHKNAVPESVTDRFSRKYEPVFMFTKGPRYYFNLDKVRVPLSEGTIKRISQKNAFKQQGGEKQQVIKRRTPKDNHNQANMMMQSLKTKWDAANNRQGTYTDSLHKNDYNLKGVNPGNVWYITTKGFAGKHYASYPEKLVKMCLLPAKPNGVVLDPFAGSGTTLKVAVELGMKPIGIELNTDYVQIIKERFADADINEAFKVIS